MMNELKPCPFCGNKVRLDKGFGGLNYFKCSSCGAMVIFNDHHYNGHKDKEIEAWNRRAE